MSVMVNPLAQSAVGAMLSEFAYRLDNGQATSLVELCTEDLAFESHMGKADLEGFRRHMTDRQSATYTTRHCINNVRLVSVTEEKIEATAVMTVTRLEPDESGSVKEIAAVLDWRLILAKAGVDYRFQSVSLKPFSVIEYRK